MYIIGIDPGTNYCGVAIFKLNNNIEIENLNTILIDLTKESNSSLFNRLNVLYNRLVYIFNLYIPIYLAVEAGYINRFRPAAYGPIAKAIYTIEKAYYDVTMLYNITEYPPSIVKNIISNNGLANKDDIEEAVYNIPDVEPFLTGYESEHEIDAISIGYTKIIEIRKYPEILIKI